VGKDRGFAELKFIRPTLAASYDADVCFQKRVVS
jgi:hypothetical protein